MQEFSLATVALACLCFAGLSGCDWVDATGIQGPEERADTTNLPDVPSVAAPVPDPDGNTDLPSALTLVENEPFLLLENSANRARLDVVASAGHDWRWLPVDVNNDELCQSFDGFDPVFAADSLENACTERSDCEIDFEQRDFFGSTVFIITLPRLKAPVALNYILEADLEDGQKIEREQPLCGISVNESPAAEDDLYRAVAGRFLTVEPDDANSLLANDLDDVDVRNERLIVDTAAVVRPQHADQFLLRPDGGFIYRAALNTALDADGNQTDRFVYRVSDGVHDAVATARIQIVADNQAPLAVGNLPDIQITVSDDMATPLYAADITPYFSDADGDLLAYRAGTDNLTDSVTITISADGVLTVETKTEPATGQGINPESGTWPVTVTADDGLSTVTTGFMLTIMD